MHEAEVTSVDVRTRAKLHFPQALATSKITSPLSIKR